MANLKIELIKQINKQIDSSRSHKSKTRKPFRNQVSHRRSIGKEERSAQTAIRFKMSVIRVRIGSRKGSFDDKWLECVKAAIKEELESARTFGTDQR